MARLPDCGLKRKEREESSDRSEDTEKLVTRAHSPPAVWTKYSIKYKVTSELTEEEPERQGAEGGGH